MVTKGRAAGSPLPKSNMAARQTKTAILVPRAFSLPRREKALGTRMETCMLFCEVRASFMSLRHKLTFY